MESMERLSGKRGSSRYHQVFLVGSTMYAGNTVEYFSRHTNTLVVYYLQSTIKGAKDFYEVYKKGRLLVTREYDDVLSLVPSYIQVYIRYLSLLLSYFSKDSVIHVISYHPLFFLFQKVLRRMFHTNMIFWVADQIPDAKGVLKIYQYLTKFYNKTLDNVLYLGDSLNKSLNGSLLQTPKKKTVMWGTRKPIKRASKPRKTTVCFIGVIREHQGVDLILKSLSKNKTLHAKILGQCHEELYTRHKAYIKRNNLEKRVYYPNTFIPTKELEKELSTCSIGVALYDTSKNHPIHYTDPGKVKTYLSYGLPVIMTKTSAIYPIVTRYKAGEIIKRDVRSFRKAVKTISKNFAQYKKGVNALCKQYYYETYYKDMFAFMEKK